MPFSSLPPFPARSWILAGMGLAAASFSSAQNPRFEPLREMLPPESDDTLGVELGDVDGDGDLDALTLNSAQGRLYLNDGSGVFEEASSNLPPGTLKSYAAALGDVDGDGDLDAVLGRAGGVGLLLNDGSGSFVDASDQVHAEMLGGAHAVLLMDLEGDTDLDLVVGVWGTPFSEEKNRVLVNDGAGSFSPATHLWQPKLHASTSALAAGDLDDDAYVDLVVGYYADQNLLYMNEGGTSLKPAPLSPPALKYNNTLDLALVDVDGDLDLDLVAANGDNEEDFLFFNYLSAGLWGVAGLEGWGTSTEGIALGDLDADGDPDLLLASLAFPPYTKGLRYLQNVGALIPMPEKLPAQGSLHNCMDVALGDLDGDADLDAWIATAGTVTDGQQDCIYLNDGAGTLVDATGAGALGGWYTRTFVWGDVDGDADADLVTGEFTGSGQGQSRLFLNDGQGELTEDVAGLPVFTEDIYSMALGDLDGDQDLDLLIAHDDYPHADRVLLNDGQGTFQEVPGSLPPAGPGAKVVALVDVEGDGDQDAFFGNYKFTPSSLYLNDGAAHFTDAGSSMPFDDDESNAAAAADVDGDGDLDIATANDESKPRLYVNSGAGSFADGGAQIPAAGEKGLDLVFADVDGDSDLDLVIADYVQDRLLLNDGAGVYSEASASLPAADSLSVDAGDFDHDADVDLVFLERLQSAMACNVYENDGTGSFEAQADAGVAEISLGVALVDLNGDDWLDLFTLGYDDRHRVYFNLERTVSRTGLPRVGKPLGMELHGTTGGAWFLAWSLGTAELELPPYGTLKLDPATLHVHAWGALDAAGAATSIVDVPDNPALTGLAVYWQGLIGEPLRASTLEVTTLTAL